MFYNVKNSKWWCWSCFYTMVSLSSPLSFPSHHLVGPAVCANVTASLPHFLWLYPLGSLWSVKGWCEHLTMLQLQHFVWKHSRGWMRSLDNRLIQATRSQTSSGQLNAVECENDSETKTPHQTPKRTRGSSRMIKFCLVRRISRSVRAWVPLQLRILLWNSTTRVPDVDQLFPRWHSSIKDLSSECFEAKRARGLCHLRHIAAPSSRTKDVLGTNTTLALGACLLLFLRSSFEDKMWGKDSWDGLYCSV